MLNETYRLLQALDAAKLTLPTDHPLVRDVGKSVGPLLRVKLGKTGHVESVETVAEKEWPGLWVVVRTSDGSFPVVRLNTPICEVDKEDPIWNLPVKAGKGISQQSIVSGLREAFQRCPKRPLQKTNWPWRDSRGKAVELVRSMRKEEREDALLRDFVMRFACASRRPGILLSEIIDHAIAALGSERLDAADTIKTLLVGKGPKDSDGKEPAMKVQLAFDLSGDTGPRGLYTVAMRTIVDGLLPWYPVQERSEYVHRAISCAYGGEGALQDSKFPSIPLPVVGKKGFSLVSMFYEKPCNMRYGLTEHTVVPVSQSVVRRLFGALRYVTLDKRKGKTWRAVANGKFEKKKEEQDLLIVYVDGKPAIDANIADFFGRDFDQTEKQFDADAKVVCSALDGVRRQAPCSKLNLFLITKVDDGKVKIAKNEAIEIEHLLESAERWQKAVTDNLPDVHTPRIPSREKGKPGAQGKITTPYPDDVVRLLAKQWVRDGSSPVVNGKPQKAYHEVEGIGLGSVLDVMLRAPGKWELEAQHILDLLLRRVGPVLIGLGGALRSYIKSSSKNALNDYRYPSQETFLRAVSVLGILLDAFGKRKERYMNESAFLVGKLFALADNLHKSYCVVVRDGSLPPSLMGNSMLAKAFDNPQMAVADLADRMRIYVGWAKTASEPSKNDPEKESKIIAVRTARETLSLYKPLADRLHEAGLPDRCDDIMKAEVLLGYLAS